MSCFDNTRDTGEVFFFLLLTFGSRKSEAGGWFINSHCSAHFCPVLEILPDFHSHAFAARRLSIPVTQQQGGLSVASSVKLRQKKNKKTTTTHPAPHTHRADFTNNTALAHSPSLPCLFVFPLSVTHFKNAAVPVALQPRSFSPRSGAAGLLPVCVLLLTGCCAPIDMLQ